MLSGETMVVYCENIMEHTGTTCEQNSEVRFIAADHSTAFFISIDLPIPRIRET
jgi:hypothetical protein